MSEIRKRQAPGRLGRVEFSVRFRATYIDLAFRAEDESIAWAKLARPHPK